MSCCSNNNNNVIEDHIQENEVVPFFGYQQDCFYEINNFKRYDDSTYTSKIGIDISEFQDKIDWKQIQKLDLDFIYIRAGRRGATTGLLYVDQEFEKHYSNAKNCNLEIGVYFFSQAINQEEAIEEAEYVLRLLEQKSIDLPIVYDMEDVYIEGARLEGLDKETKTLCAKTFCDYIKEKGYDAMIYTGQYWSENSYDMDKLCDYPNWLAYYGENYNDFLYPFVMWQYTDEATIKGIEGYTDLDIMFVLKENANE